MRGVTVLVMALTCISAVAPMRASAMQNDSQSSVDVAQEGREWRYRVSGERALRPEQISDDGDKTYLVWGADQALPAVFAINAFGGEEIVDGYMRDGVFTIDRVYTRLVFRIDRKVAKADRLTR
jgi:type IV secretion system protein VirB9